jgi:trimeric autotransporter adhesin
VSGKTSTSTSAVNVPPAVLAQYQSVNAQAQQTAATPFQDYTGEFVAPVNAEQTSGIAATNTAANEAQPYYSAATGVLGATQGSTVPVNTAAEIGTAESAAPLSASEIDQYLSPYLGTVLNSTEQLQNISNQQQQAGQLGDAITSGAFGSDRTGLAAANLEEQQNLTNANVISGIANTGYQSALGTAQGEQQIGLAGAQQLASIGSTAYGEGANTASELASLGTGAESAGLAGAQAQIAAGTVEQQTQQAQDTAAYNQFLQQQSYPFQVDQFLANIAEGTGSLSGSTTTTTQPGGFFSDKRLKRDIKKIGKTFDGQDVYTYKMGDDDRTRIGLIAQEVEKKRPDAVGLAGGFKMVDYGKATEKAANQGHFYQGGVVPFPRKHRDAGGGLSGVLDAQRQMYSNMPGSSQQRQINQGGGGGGARSLAVSNAPATPPPSGASELSQTMGLANNANKLYQSFSGPSAASGAGLNAGVAADASGTTDALAGYEAGSAGAADAALGADAASVAAPAAADAAGSAAAGAAAGAAGTAAVGAGTEAAADAAAALAAEYAAADIGVGALAVAAAKRGGKIRRPGLDAGGVPYLESGSDPSGDLNIPQDPNTNTLHAAPGAGKQPTGFQSMLTMSDPSNWDSIMGSTFSNQALATGGVAGRRGFDDGGTVDPDDPDAPGPDAAAPATDASTPSSTGSSGGLGALWDKIKGSADWAVPVLSGIGAMGTAKTVHPGVALAAGLGALADTYVPTQEGLAKAEQTQAVAHGQELQNQMTQLGLGQARKALAPTAPATPTTPVRPVGMVSGDPTDPAEIAFQQFAPLPTARPASVNSQILGLKYAKLPDAANQVGDNWDQQAKSTNQTRALGANAAYESMAAIATSAPGQAIGMVAKANPQKAAQIQQASNDPAVQDQQARQWAASYALNAHQFSGRPTTMNNGVMIDTQTGTPVVGQDQVMTGLTPEAKAAAYEEAMQPVTLGNGLPGRNYQLAGMASPEQYVINKDRAARLSGATKASNAAAASTVAPVPGSTSAVAPRAPPAANAPPSTAPSPARSAPAPTAISPTGDPTFDKALAGATSDVRYRENPGPRIVDQNTKALALSQQQLNQANRNALLNDASAITSEQSTARQYLLAARQIMQSPDAPMGGFPGVVQNAILSKFNTVTASNRAEVAKYLINAAVQQGHTNFPNATQGEFAQQVNQMSPNLEHMPTQAVNNLINTGIRTSDYMLKSADRANVWAKVPGVEPLAFNDFNQRFFPRDKFINAQRRMNPATGEMRYLVNGQWVQ